jgi:hypothetical protein
MASIGYGTDASSGGRGHLLRLLGRGRRYLLGLLGRQRLPLLDEPMAVAFIITILLPPPLDDAMRALEEEEALGFTSW